MFVKEGAVLPLAEPLMYVPENAVFDITLRIYGAGDGFCTLIGDDGYSNDYKVKGVDRIKVSVIGDSFTEEGSHPRYHILGVDRVL
jgi:alpha-D-xyloside xylohydrolase